MSRDIFVQDIPAGIESVDEIPDGWLPQPLPFGHAEVVDAVRALAPDADVSESEWLRVSLRNAEVEVDVSRTTPLESFALHVRAERRSADAFIGALLRRLNVRAFDSESETGIFVQSPV